jgi:hypothetical protein
MRKHLMIAAAAAALGTATIVAAPASAFVAGNGQVLSEAASADVINVRDRGRRGGHHGRHHGPRFGAWAWALPFAAAPFVYPRVYAYDYDDCWVRDRWGRLFNRCY